MITTERLKSTADPLLKEIIAIRRHLHQHPELSFEEHQTAAFIEEQLKKEGISYRKGFAGTGIVGVIKGKNPASKVVALRADMDALPINEQNDVEYKSKSAGKMHACGHDAHMAALLGAAKILNALKAEMGGTVLLIFQPAEEKLPGGARQMIDEGALKDPRPDIIIGQHVMPGMPSGKVGFRAGMYMASSDEIYITVKGKGGHAAMPHQVIDPVVIASSIIVALQQVVSRFSNPLQPTVLSFGSVEAKGAVNVIPDCVKLEGTFRTLDETWRAEAHKKITTLAKSIAEGMGGSCDITIKKGYPVLTNDPELTKKAMDYSARLLGDENVTEMDVRLTSEDFAFYSSEFPAVFYRFGTSDNKGHYSSQLHTATFDIDENALYTGMTNLAWLALSFLE
ncbi:MAG: amidohydrolase [Bacteroidales bacterium]|nr:amidohydrolase [Bacteroidales bacterium]MBN2762271.1 amidohydrolase [Bacteroidales bacterium]